MEEVFTYLQKSIQVDFGECFLMFLSRAVATACKHTVQFKVNDDRPMWEMAYFHIGLL
jgi:hypothetical protein